MLSCSSLICTNDLNEPTETLWLTVEVTIIHHSLSGLHDKEIPMLITHTLQHSQYYYYIRIAFSLLSHTNKNKFLFSDIHYGYTVSAAQKQEKCNSFILFKGNWQYHSHENVLKWRGKERQQVVGGGIAWPLSTDGIVAKCRKLLPPPPTTRPFQE